MESEFTNSLAQAQADAAHAMEWQSRLKPGDHAAAWSEEGNLWFFFKILPVPEDQDPRPLFTMTGTQGKTYHGFVSRLVPMFTVTAEYFARVQQAKWVPNVYEISLQVSAAQLRGEVVPEFVQAFTPYLAAAISQAMGEGKPS